MTLRICLSVLAIASAAAALPAKAVEPPHSTAECASPANPLAFFFNPCGTNEAFYAWEREEMLRRIANGTATPFDYANYRFLTTLTDPGDDTD